LDSMLTNPVQVKATALPRLHAIDWFTHSLQPQFSIRQIKDCLDSGHLLVRRKNRPNSLWCPVYVKTFTRNRGTVQRLVQASDNYTATSFLSTSRYKNAIYFVIGLSRLSPEFEDEVVTTYGGALGDDFPTRFEKFPIESIAMHSEYRDFHEKHPLKMYPDNTFSDPTVNYQGLSVISNHDLLEVLTDFKSYLENVLLQREQAGVMLPYLRYFTADSADPVSKRVEGLRFLTVRDMCFGNELVSFATMRGGPIDFNLLRKTDTTFETVSIQMKSFSPPTKWAQYIVRMGDIVMDNHVKLDLLLLIEELPGRVVLYFVDWRYYYDVIIDTMPDGVFHFGGLAGPGTIPNITEAGDNSHITMMEFQVGHRSGVTAEFRKNIDKYFRLPNYLENLYISSGEFELELGH